MIQRLLPQPQELSYLDGTFAPNAETLIVVPAQAGDDVFLAARQLQDEVCGKGSGRTVPGLQLPIVKSFVSSHAQNVILLICGR